MCFLSWWRPVRFWPPCSRWRWRVKSACAERSKGCCLAFLPLGDVGMTAQRQIHVMLTVMVTLTIGCESGDERLARYAQQATELQARQNELSAQNSHLVAKQSQDLTQAASHLVDKDADARRELIAAHERQVKQFQAERANLDLQRESVEQRRQELADAERREPLLAQSLESAALLVTALLPLLVAIYALRQLRRQGENSDLLTEVLVEELTAAEPHLRLDARNSAPGRLPTAGSADSDPPQ